jgi:hypothetical protein
MTVRLEVRDDLSIEVMRPNANGKSTFLHYDDINSAIRIARYYLRKDLETAKQDLFVSEADRNAQRELIKLLKESL